MGAIEDATCDVEQLERANDSQLHVILAELMTTGFFRNFAVDLDHRCPLAGWDTTAKKEKKGGKKGEERQQRGDGTDGGEQGGAGGASSSDENAADAFAAAAFGTTKAAAPTTTNASDEGHEGIGEECAGGLPDSDTDAEPACAVESDSGGGPSWLDGPGFPSAGGGAGASATTWAALVVP